MISPARILSAYLIAQGKFVAPASSPWPLYIASMPDTDNVESNLGVIYDTDGVKDGRLMAGENIIHEGVQVRVRAEDYNAGHNKAREVEELFETTVRESVTIETVEYMIESISQTSSIIPLGPEDGTTRREIFTINFLATIKEV